MLTRPKMTLEKGMQNVIAKQLGLSLELERNIRHLCVVKCCTALLLLCSQDKK